MTKTAKKLNEFGKHVHGTWSFMSKADYVTYYCGSEGVCDLDNAMISITLKAADSVYTGEAAEVSIEGIDEWEALGLPVPSIELYYGTTESSTDQYMVYDQVESAVNAGYYTAYIAFGSIRPGASVNFKITRAVPSFDTPEGLTAVVGETLADVELPEGFTWADDSASVGESGVNTFEAVYTPADTVNYETVSGIKVDITVKTSAEIFAEYKANAAESLSSLLQEGDNKACSDLVARAQEKINALRYNNRNSLEQNEEKVEQAAAREAETLNSQLEYIRKHTPEVDPVVRTYTSNAVLGYFVANPVSVPFGVVATYSSSDTSIARVGKLTGIITARGEGTVTITCSYYESVTRQMLTVSYELIIRKEPAVVTYSYSDEWGESKTLTSADMLASDIQEYVDPATGKTVYAYNGYISATACAKWDDAVEFVAELNQEGVVPSDSSMGVTGTWRLINSSEDGQAWADASGANVENHKMTTVPESFGGINMLWSSVTYSDSQSYSWCCLKGYLDWFYNGNNPTWSGFVVVWEPDSNN